MKARDAGRITAAEMKYTIKRSGHTWIVYKTDRDGKRTKHSRSFEHGSGIQKKLFTTYKQNAP
jgi:hypothetical protein